LISGYGAIIVNVLYTILSVRLSLTYLGKEQFGLWALALQISGYMTLLDFGMSQAISRFVADHKDDVNGGKYGGVLLMGGLVFACQGTLVAILGSAFSLIAPELFHIPTKFGHDFQWVLVIISILSGLSIATRSIGAPLWAFQRLDVLNFVGITTLITSLPTLWVGFKVGWGIYSLAYAGIPSVILSPIILIINCHRNEYYPKKGNWGTPSWSLFYKLFGFGRDALVMSLGSQLVNASQIIILSRISGLDAAATYSIGTKLYTMAQQFVGKILDSSIPGLTEMFIRGDWSGFNTRFWNIIAITMCTAILGVVGILAGNQAVLKIWTSSAIHWSFESNILLSLLLIGTCVSRCFVSIFSMVGDLRRVRYIYLLETFGFMLVAIPFTRYFGINGILLASVMAQIGITVVVSIRSASRILESTKELLSLCIKTSYILIPIVVVAAVINSISGNNISILFEVIILLIVVAIACFAIILSKETRQDIINKILLLKNKLNQ
jgi:O-antigen/teichoic acid export membrane protein